MSADIRMVITSLATIASESLNENARELAYEIFSRRAEWWPPAVPEKPKQKYEVAVKCAREGCGTTTVQSLGSVDPNEYRCGHTLRFDGMRGGLTCSNCQLHISMMTLREANLDPLRGRYCHDDNMVADAAMTLSDENKEVLAENARLRRHIEKLERRKR